jgi:hypothetical protein
MNLQEIKRFQKIAGLLNENELAEISTKWTLDQAKAAYESEYPIFSPETLANFSYDNFDKITGQPLEDRDQESHFPEEISELCDAYGISEFDDDFMYSFGYK